MIFETERLLIRRLQEEDLSTFYDLESNPEVLKYEDGCVKNLKETKEELFGFIRKYDEKNNYFWIYAVERKQDGAFIGTVALINSKFDTEIGYRLIQNYWANGYGLELCKALINYARKIVLQRLIAFVIDKNIASKKILEQLFFKVENCFLNEELQLQETKYVLEL